jgi:hypothetical protein
MLQVRFQNYPVANGNRVGMFDIPDPELAFQSAVHDGSIVKPYLDPASC